MALTLYEKALLCEALVQERHYYEGQIRTHVILPPVGASDYSSGNHESDALSTGMYLQALSFRWAATKDPEAKHRAKEVARGLRKLQGITGVPGCFARGFKRAHAPTWDEQAFFFPREWHQAGEYRWVGDPSTDSLVGLMSGYEQYYDLVADAKEKREVARDVDSLMGRILEANMRILDVDGRMTLWGNMCPLILEEDLNALQALSHLRGAYHITKKRRYLAAYYRLIEQHDYHKKAARANAQKDSTPSAWDWNLAASPLYSLLQYEKDPALLRYYYRALEAQWEGVHRAGVHEPFVDWAYKAFHPQAPIRKETIEWLHSVDLGAGAPAARGKPQASKSLAQRRQIRFVLDGKPKVVSALVEVLPRNWLRAYWMGRYHGFISPEE